MAPMPLSRLHAPFDHPDWIFHGSTNLVANSTAAQTL
jgi:hypothetical protein